MLKRGKCFFHLKRWRRTGSHCIRMSCRYVKIVTIPRTAMSVLQPHTGSSSVGKWLPLSAILQDRCECIGCNFSHSQSINKSMHKSITVCTSLASARYGKPPNVSWYTLRYAHRSRDSAAIKMLFGFSISLRITFVYRFTNDDSYCKTVWWTFENDVVLKD